MEIFFLIVQDFSFPLANNFTKITDRHRVTQIVFLNVNILRGYKTKKIIQHKSLDEKYCTYLETNIRAEIFHVLCLALNQVWEPHGRYLQFSSIQLILWDSYIKDNRLNQDRPWFDPRSTPLPLWCSDWSRLVWSRLVCLFAGPADWGGDFRLRGQRRHLSIISIMCKQLRIQGWLELVSRPKFWGVGHSLPSCTYQRIESIPMLALSQGSMKGWTYTFVGHERGSKALPI